MDEGQAEALVNAGWALVRAGNSRGAVKQFKSALALDPEHIGALSGLAQSHLNLGEIDDARQTADAILRVAPNRSVGHRLRAEVLRRTHKLPAAMEAAKQAIALDPREPLGYHLLALCHSQRKAYRAAIKTCEEGLAQAPYAAILMAQQAENLLETKGPVKAEPLAEDALKAAPESIYVLRIAAKIALARGQLEKARALLESVLQRNANDETAISLYLMADPSQHRVPRAFLIFRYWRTTHPFIGNLVHLSAFVLMILGVMALMYLTKLWGIALVIGARLFVLSRYRAHRNAVKAHFQSVALDKDF